ncbi:MAG: hypothetical protein WAX89_00295 [Alphaproteobacteria bacterium]
MRMIPILSLLLAVVLSACGGDALKLAETTLPATSTPALVSLTAYAEEADLAEPPPTPDQYVLLREDVPWAEHRSSLGISGAALANVKPELIDGAKRIRDHGCPGAQIYFVKGWLSGAAQDAASRVNPWAVSARQSEHPKGNALDIVLKGAGCTKQKQDHAALQVWHGGVLCYPPNQWEHVHLQLRKVRRTRCNSDGSYAGRGQRVATRGAGSSSDDDEDDDDKPRASRNHSSGKPSSGRDPNGEKAFDNAFRKEF